MTELEQTIKDSCTLAKNYYEKNQSPKALISSSGYLRFHELITEEKIHRYIEQNPDLKAFWFTYSENKRTSTGWYISAEHADGPYLVGFLGDDEIEEEKYEDFEAASARYIKKELDTLIK